MVKQNAKRMMPEHDDVQEQDPQMEFDFSPSNKTLKNVFKENFIMFEGTSQYGKPYKVLVVKKKHAFDPALIALCEGLGVITLPHDGSNWKGG